MKRSFFRFRVLNAPALQGIRELLLLLPLAPLHIGAPAHLQVHSAARHIFITNFPFFEVPSRCIADPPPFFALTVISAAKI
jgi:hypothetical protein